MPTNMQAILEDIDRVLQEADKIRTQTHTVRNLASRWLDHEPSSRTTTSRNTEDVTRASMMLSSAISRYAPPASPFRAHADEILEKSSPSNDYTRQLLVGVLKAIRFEYESGGLSSIVELVHRDLFADFLEMAQHLVEKGFKDPAAVVAAGVLEQHLRQLVQRHGVPTLKDNGEPKTAQLLNDDLTKARAYDAPTQKEVTAMIALRNQAAHGEWEKYEHRKVALFIEQIRHFLSRHPA